MTFAILSTITAFIIAFGRQISVFSKVKRGLWFFSNFEFKRFVFLIISIAFGLLSLKTSSISTGVFILLGLSVFFSLFSYFFDMKYFFPEISHVIHKSARDMKVEDDIQIIGLTINQDAFAYPLNEVVIPRHIINDEIEGHKILISFCALCQSALAFRAEVANKKLYFKVAGVWRRNMIIIDNQTQSLWQQATGECIYGPLKGSQLPLLSGENTTYAEWKKQHPFTFFASECKEARQGFWTREKMNKLLHRVVHRVTMPGYSDLSELPEREIVFGIIFNGISRAYPKSALLQKRFFEDQFHNKLISLEYIPEAEYLYARDKITNQRIIIEKHWWLGWKEFHPETKIWKDNEPS